MRLAGKYDLICVPARHMYIYIIIYRYRCECAETPAASWGCTNLGCQMVQVNHYWYILMLVVQTGFPPIAAFGAKSAGKGAALSLVWCPEFTSRVAHQWHRTAPKHGSPKEFPRISGRALAALVGTLQQLWQEGHGYWWPRSHLAAGQHSHKMYQNVTSVESSKLFRWLSNGSLWCWWKMVKPHQGRDAKASPIPAAPKQAWMFWAKRRPIDDAAQQFWRDGKLFQEQMRALGGPIRCQKPWMRWNFRLWMMLWKRPPPQKKREHPSCWKSNLAELH